jgi:hypothetical protein
MSEKEVLATLTAALRKFLPKYEGNVTWMYLDQGGLVHTGIGFNIDSLSDAQKLPWRRNFPPLRPWKFTLPPVDPSTGWRDRAVAGRLQPAQLSLPPVDLLPPNPDPTKFWTSLESVTPDDVQAEWQRIKDLQHLKGKGAMYFMKYTTVHLTQDAVNAKFREEVMDRDRRLRNIFKPGYDTFPADARMAMLVHAWANDPSNFLKPPEQRGWPGYVAACKGRRWKEAFKESHWATNPERYKAMGLMFTNAWALEEAAKRGGMVDFSRLYYTSALPPPPPDRSGGTPAARSSSQALPERGK